MHDHFAGARGCIGPESGLLIERDLRSVGKREIFVIVTGLADAEHAIDHVDMKREREVMSDSSRRPPERSCLRPGRWEDT